MTDHISGQLTIVSGATSAAHSVTAVDRFSSFWVLGDSLSDPGNVFAATGGLIPQSPPYADGRFSNGPVWAEYMAADFELAGKPVGNVAHGGATAITDGDLIPDLDAQIALTSLSATLFGDRPLAAVWFGGNDILGAADPLAEGVSAARHIALGIGALSGLGFNDFLLFDLPGLSADALAFNAALGAEVPGLRAAGYNILDVDVTGVINAIAADPDSDITNFTDPCVITQNNVVVSACSPQEAKERLRFDAVHPNAEVHERLALAATAELATVPLPASGVLFAAGLLALGAAAKRRERPS